MKKMFLEVLGKIAKMRVFAFLLGIFVTMITISLISQAQAGIQSSPQQQNADSQMLQIPNIYQPETRDKPSPNNYIDEKQIKVYKDRIVIDIENTKWAGFMDTKSMLPIINKDSNGLQIEPKCPEEIKLGDIISYKSKYSKGIIIHRVVHIDQDDEGIYFIMKGDNNPANDPGKIRCNQIERKLIGVLY